MVGDCYDNAIAESFFATLECALLDRIRFPDPKTPGEAIFEFIEAWYDPTGDTPHSATCRP